MSTWCNYGGMVTSECEACGEREGNGCGVIKNGLTHRAAPHTLSSEFLLEYKIALHAARKERGLPPLHTL